MKTIFVSPFTSLKEALKKLDETAEKILLVVGEDSVLLGTLTDGDIRRYILKTGTLEGTVEFIYNRNPLYAVESQSKSDVKNLIFKNKIEVLPIVNNQKQIVGFYRWVDFYDKDIEKLVSPSKINIPVVIMAGGMGTRLVPFTRVLPKPLLPIKDKTITELIIDTFKKYGVRKFYLTLNYKGKVIESYFNSIEKDYEIEFIWEDKFLGTAGSLYLLKNKIKTDFFVSNCDIILKANYSEVYAYHKDMNVDFTAITSVQHYSIPYGVVHTQKGGFIERIEEKPEHTFQINTGVYLLSRETLDFIPSSEYLDMPQLIEKLIENKRKIIAYPINEKDYLDVGQWEEYGNALKIFE